MLHTAVIKNIPMLITPCHQPYGRKKLGKDHIVVATPIKNTVLRICATMSFLINGLANTPSNSDSASSRAGPRITSGLRSSFGKLVVESPD